MIETGEVSIGVDGEWNHLTFDEVMSVPEEPVEKGSNAPVEDSKGKQPVARPAADITSKPTKLPKLRPRVHVEDEIVWRTLTGHGPDLRRVPNLEWKLLIAIGATKDEGILQGDLVRATGQDKRSVPKRTDFLSLKGYIAKRTHMVRGTKTSKLWLAQFAPALPAPANPLRGFDMSAETLTMGMEPVPWKNQWVDNKGKNGKEEIAYMALGHTIMALIKAWGTVRIRDLKRKLGILGRKWQMKVMSKFLRRFDVQGNISYVAATFPGDNFVFKDCVQFEREPTLADWNKLLATGKKHSQYSELRDKMPTKKLPKKVVKSKKGKGKGKGRTGALSKSNLPTLNEENRNLPNPMDANWVQEKPLANILAEYVLTGAEEGYTAPEISKATVGSAFRRQIFAHMNNVCVPDAQPSNLKEFQMRSQLKIVGKTRARTFIASGACETEMKDRAEEEELVDPALRGHVLGTEALDRSDIQATSDAFGFGAVQASAFLEDGTTDLAILGRMEPGKPAKTKRSFVRRGLIDVNAQEGPTVDKETPGKAEATIGQQSNAATQGQMANGDGKATKPGVQNQTAKTGAPADVTIARPARKRKASQRVSYLNGVVERQENANADADGTPAPKRRATQKLGDAQPAETPEEPSSDESDVEQDRSNPGVYFGIPGSLNPNPYKKGRPRKSIVLIFRSDKIKDPNYLPGWTAYPRPPTPPQSTLIPRKKHTRPLAADFASPAPAASHLQSEQREQAEAKEPQAHSEASAPESTQVGEGGIVVQNAETQEKEEAGVQPSASATTNANSNGEASTMDTSTATMTQVSENISRAQRAGRKSKGNTRKWVCDKCGGEWKNDIGLKYHLEKAKVPCNPYYAEHPELMVKAKSVRTSRATLANPEPESDSARPGTSSSSSSGGSLHSIGATRPPPKKARSAPKRSSLAPEVAEDGDPAIPRPVLKQRSTLKKRHGISGVVAPRGVQVSEAAAKETAAAKPTESSQDTATPANMIAKAQSHAQSARSEDEDAEEELPYLKQIRAEQARFSRRTLSKPSVTPSEDHGKAARLQSGGDEEMHGTAAGSGSQFMEADAVDPGLYIGTNQTSATFDPYPTGVLERAAPGSAPHGYAASTEKSNRRESVQQSQGPENSPYGSRTIEGVPPFKRPPGDHIVDFKECLATEESTLRALRISAIIEYLVDVNGGVFQTERVLHWAVMKVYMTVFPGWPLPSLPGCSRAMGELINLGKLRRDTMAVKTTRLWRMVTIVMRPDMNMSMKPVEDLRLILKTVLPDVYIPPPFAPTENEKAMFRERERPVKPRGKGPGRRDHKLVEGIAQLTAPFYAEKGMAGIRPNYRGSRAKVQSDDEDDQPKRGRRSKNRNQVSENGAIEFYPKMRRKRKQTEVDNSPSKKQRRQTRLDDDDLVEPQKLSIDGSRGRNPGISSLPASFFSNTAAPNSSYRAAPTMVRFFEPNTHLEDDYVPSPELEEEEECQIDPRLLAASTVIEPIQELKGESLPIIGEVSFTPIIALNDVKGSNGTWPDVSSQWFEENDASVTMKGWAPNQTAMLIDNIPKNMEQMSFRITRTEQWTDPDYGDFCASVDGCKLYELSEQGQRSLSGSVAPNLVFINFSTKPGVSNMAPCNLQWDEQNEWTIETIPYEMLKDDDDVSKPKVPGSVPLDSTDNRMRAEGGPPVSSRPKPQESVKPVPRKYVRKPEKGPRLRELKVQRELTPYPQQSDEYFRVKGDSSFGVDWKAEDTRIAAYVAVSTLMGGINKAMDWGLMMRIFPEAKLSNLRKFWAMIKKEREGFINSLTDKFQEEFLEAYEKGVLRPFDFDDPVAYGVHWLELVKWTLALVVKESIELPPNRQQFDVELELVPADKGDFDWRDMYHHWQRSVFNKLQDSTSEPASTILETNQKTADNDLVVSRSWIRALCCTEPKKYTPYQIRDKFLTLVRKGVRTATQVNELLEATVFDLEHRRVAIKQRAHALATGRPYKLNEHFSRTLDRYSNEDKFSVAAEFKLKMDNAFRKGETVEIPWRTEDGMVLAAFNLQAHGRVRLEPVKRMDIPFGFKPGFYESRKYPKSYYRFDLKVTPTPTYLYNEDIEILHRATAKENIPGETEDGKLPMWCDFFGKAHRGRWFKMLAGVLFVLATRGAMTDQYATQALKPCFEQFEVEIIRKWGLKEGVLREITVSGGAVSITEWWWLVVGMPMLEMTEHASQGAVAGTAGSSAGAGEGGRRTKDQYAEFLGRSRRRGKYRMIH